MTEAVPSEPDEEPVVPPRLATGPDSWGVWFARDPAQPPWTQFLDEAAAAEYRAIELGPWGYLPTDERQLGKELDDRGLELCAVTCLGHLEDTDAWPQLSEDIEQAASLAVARGAAALVLIDTPYTDLRSGKLVRAPALNETEWERLVQTTVRAARMVHERWHLPLAFHAHAETHVETERQLERLLSETTGAPVSLCFDTGHHAYCGGDVYAFLRRHLDRIVHLHVKDVDSATLEGVREQGCSFSEAVRRDVFVEPGTGALDWAALVRILGEARDIRWAVVEQDMYPAPADKPEPIAKRTHKHLVELGLAP